MNSESRLQRSEKCKSYVPVNGSPRPGALQYCLDARDFDPTRWEAFRQLARVYYSLGEYQKSIDNNKHAISLMIGLDYEKITEPTQIKSEFNTEFSLMSYGIAMGLVGVANVTKTNTADKIAKFQESLRALKKGLWFITETPSSENPLFGELLYLEALDSAYIWFVSNVRGVETTEFDVAVEKFKRFLNLPGVVPQWAEYHLACLYVEASKRLGTSSASDYVIDARKSLANALHDLLRTQNEKSIVQNQLMKCRLFHPDNCQPPLGSEPMICSGITTLVEGDQEICSLASAL